MQSKRISRHLPSFVAMLPTTLFVVIIYLGCMAWTVAISFTTSKVLPVARWAGATQYERLLATERWTVSVHNILIYGACYILGCLLLGFLTAVAIDQKVRFENTLRTIYLFPYALSFIVTGAVWQWIFDPQLGIEAALRGLGLESHIGILSSPGTAIAALVIAAVWQGAGLVMVMLLAGLRSVDGEILKAARVDGIPIWRAYVSIILPELRPMIVTSVVLLAIAVVKAYDLIVSMTQGGPGIGTEMPAKFVMDHLFERGNIGLATAAATLMLLAVLAVLVPWLHLEYFRKAKGGAR
ncbi:sugar ABC transporter permease (plasmid) [Shinella sp. PSBB067]|uniref:carbohydrate ABC transporter permease n=1 Tax=Shinella sp. PSBB067 TaxID=2715959 RepID=UPI00193C5D4F|nr:sugar ABC transporter permease [Shinella sp. PSBB067]QRI66302.1 sugar ABC transporter permease [Shinella sp. PSBB067]